MAKEKIEGLTFKVGRLVRQRSGQWEIHMNTAAFARVLKGAMLISEHIPDGQVLEAFWEDCISHESVVIDPH